jgi:fructoselysine 6-kinase
VNRLHKVRVATVGDNCIDRYVGGGGDRVAVAAGNAVNVAVHLARLGFDVDYYGAVGRDAEGDAMVRTLSALGVGVAHLRRLTVPTSVTEVTLGAAGDRIFSAFAPGAAEAYRPTDEEVAGLAAYAFVHVTALPDLPGQLAAIVAHAGSVSCDFSDDEPPEPCTGLALAVVSVAEEASDDAAVGVARRLVAAGAALGLVLRGAVGSVGVEGRRIVQVAAPSVKAVDTCGAGDTFIAYLLAERHGDADVETAMCRATEAAARTCGHLGAWPQEWLTTGD